MGKCTEFGTAVFSSGPAAVVTKAKFKLTDDIKVRPNWAMDGRWGRWAADCRVALLWGWSTKGGAPWRCNRQHVSKLRHVGVERSMGVATPPLPPPPASAASLRQRLSIISTTV